MKVLKSYGTNGEVIVSVSPSDPKDINLNEPVFIYFDELPVPFFIESLEEKGNRFLVKFEDIDTLDDADNIVGKDVLFSEEEENTEETPVQGIYVYDQNGTKIGPITEFNDYSGNTCITVDHNGCAIELPYNEHLIIKTTKDSITLTIPDGLL